jgi:hypothetical protein
MLALPTHEVTNAPHPFLQTQHAAPYHRDPPLRALLLERRSFVLVLNMLGQMIFVTVCKLISHNIQ